MKIQCLLLFSIFSLVFLGCNTPKDTVEKTYVNPEFSAYISAFTSGDVSRGKSIKVVLAQPIDTNKYQLGEALPEGLFEFSPSVDGTARYTDPYTIEFDPEEWLESGTRYSAIFHLGELQQVTEGFEEFNFDFYTFDLDYNVFIKGFDKNSTYEKVNVAGEVLFTDVIDTNSLASLLTITGADDKKASWRAIDDLTYEFTLLKCDRKETEYTIDFAFNGNELGIEKEDNKSFVIPALGDFKITDVTVDNGIEQYITVNFSDPIKENQQVSTFFRLDGAGTLKAVVLGNTIKLYPTNRINGEKTLQILSGLKNTMNYRMVKGKSIALSFFAIKPQLELLGKGNILPSTNKGLLLPFKSVNANSVIVTITKVFTDNIGQFLQVNELSGTYQMHRVARKVLRKRINLKSLKDVNISVWNEYSLDLSEYVNVDPGAIYHVTLSIDKKGSNYPCKSEDSDEESLTELTVDTEFEGWDEGDAGGYGYYNRYRYNYRDKNNPCTHSYYRYKEESRNILASNLGITVKAGPDHKYHVFVADLLTTNPKNGAEVQLLDYQQQVVGTGTTDGNGMVAIQPNRQPFLAVVKHNGQTGYLKVRDGYSLSTSKFETEGQTMKEGLKGYMYTERGVRRPGDSIYVALMLEDQTNKLPENHPVHFELVNPKGKTMKKFISIGSKNGIYIFRTNTDAEDQTGNWSCRANVGNATFYQNIKVETVKPNRLKIKLDFNQEIITKNNPPKADLYVEWLHGAIAKDLDSKIEMHLKTDYYAFGKYRDFVFVDPLYEFSHDNQVVFEGKINNEGKANFSPKFDVSEYVPGMLKAYFKTRVFEKTGDFSVDQFSVKFSPYTSYVGISTPKTTGWGNALETGKDHQIGVVVLDENGKKITRKGVKVKVYKIENNWWWDNYNRDLASYINRKSTKLVLDSVMDVNSNGKSYFNLKEEYPKWGRYLIRVTDPVSGHSSGKLVFVDWPYWQRSQRADQDYATMLNFQSSKKSYNVGEEIKVSFPTGGSEKALITIENGIKVLKSFWVETKEQQTHFTMEATPEMAPNIYVSISLIQPHGKTKNDMPIRMYGTVPVTVENPASHIHPVISMPDEIRPESKVKIKVSEKEGKGMYYTLAMVDEGLLDLTRFQTPDPWRHFYAKQALGIKTWDMYDHVIGSYGAELNRILSIGGDGVNAKKGGQKANRFKPMVKFLGEFWLPSGEDKVHEIEIPNYIGRCRVMVVARNKNSYGNTEKSVKVKKPLMVLATLPRVLGPQEELVIPANVFALNDGIGAVKVQLETNELIEVVGSKTQIINFKKSGDKIVGFPVKVANKIGFGKVKVTVTAGKETAKHEIEINVRASNPMIDNVQEVVVKPGETWSSGITYPGIEGTNSGVFEVSTFPAINLGKRLRYLIRYPHGCIEQTTSSVFPQLHLSKVMNLTTDQKRRIIENITQGIARITKFQTDEGGLAYWPGGSSANEWGSNYAGHFLLEAKSEGYKIPSQLMENWEQYQKSKAKSWRYSGDRSYEYNTQAYRLYTLAKAGAPDFASMNYLKSRVTMPTSAKWRLAAAYALSGQTDVAKDMINNLPTVVEDYRELSYSFGSGTRDMAMILESLVEMNEQDKSIFLAKEIANRLGESRWMSTQTTAYSLLGVSKFLGNNRAKEMEFDISFNDKKAEEVNAIIPFYKVDLSPVKHQKVKITNNGKSLLFIKLVESGIPTTDDRTEAQSHVVMDITYKDLDGHVINPDTIEQGTDFKAEVQIKNPGTKGYLREMALNQIFPSGWEIHNSRMDLYDSEEGSRADYKDIRDDRVYTYYRIGVGSVKVFTVKLNAAYKGRFYLPSVETEAMYDNTINARVKGKWVVVE